MTETKHDALIRKKALAKEYAERMHKRRTEMEKTYTDAQLSFFQYTEKDASVYTDLMTAMRRSETVPSEYIADNLMWLFDLAIPKREYASITYFADRLREYPYSDSYTRRSFRASDNGSYSKKLQTMIQHSSMK